MSTYEELKGLKVKYLSSDTSGDRIQEGEIFYNSTGFALKSFVATQAFSAGTNLSTGRSQLAGSTSGTQSANFVVGGEIPSDSTLSDACEEYNGNGYSVGGDLGTARRKFAGGGTLTAGIVFGGAEQPNSGKTETYDGSSFSEVNDMNTARAQHAGVGTQTAALAAGGYDTARTGKTEEYNGTSWSEQNDMSIARSQLNSSAGTQTAMFIGGGNYKPGSLGYTRYSEEYDGTSWSSGGSLAVGKNGAFGFGSINVGVVAGGEISGGSHPTTTEIYDSTSFASSPATIANGRMSGTGAGTGSGLAGTTGIIQGGAPGGTPTEEFNTSILAVTAAAWASGGNMNTARRAMSGGAGTATAGLVAGGYITNFSNATEEYNGSSWSNGGNYPASKYYAMIAGTQTAGLGVGGGDPVVAETCEYNGSSWTDVGNAPESRKMMGRSGTQTAALFAGGNDGPNAAVAEAFTYDGSSFTNITDLPSNRGSGHVSGGSQTASVHAAGSLGPPGYTDTTVEWNGSAWGAGGTHLFSGQSQMNSNNTGGYNNSSAGGYGTSAAPSGVTSVGCTYDGTSWFTTASMSTARQQGSGFGGVDDFVVCAGTTGSATNATEEFTGESTATSAIKTVDFD